MIFLNKELRILDVVPQYKMNKWLHKPEKNPLDTNECKNLMEKIMILNNNNNINKIYDIFFNNTKFESYDDEFPSDSENQIGGIMHKKYIKYKNKYIQLKKQISK